MGIEQEQQLYAFLYAVLTGCLLGCLYDCIRILRVFFGVSSFTKEDGRLKTLSLPFIGSVYPVDRREERRRYRLFWLAVGDMCFAILAGCAFCVFLYHFASGCFRWFYLLGCSVGFFAYYFSLGRLVVLSSEMLAFLLRVFLRYLGWLLCLPFRAVRSLTVWVCRLFIRRILLPILISIKHRARMRYTRRLRTQLKFLVCFSEIELGNE